MTDEAIGPVWIDPPKYWAAIKGKNDDEVAQMFEHITELLRSGRVDLVRKFEFVTGVGPYQRHPAQRDDSP